MKTSQISSAILLLLNAVQGNAACVPSAPRPDVLSDAVAMQLPDSSDVADTPSMSAMDGGSCVNLDANAYVITDDGWFGGQVPSSFPCLVVGVNEACTGNPIDGATVELTTIDGNAVLASYTRGRYYSEMLGCRGEYTLRVSKPGFLPATLVARATVDRNPMRGSRWSDYPGVRLVAEPDAGR